MLYIGSKLVESAYIGNKHQPDCYMGSVHVYPGGSVYTYELTNARYEFSNTTTYLMANQGNYAVMVANLNKYKDGKLEETKKVSLSNIEIPKDGDIIIYTDGIFYWNKEKYGKTNINFGHVNIRGQYSDMVAYADLSYGNNFNHNFDYSVINSFSIGGNTSNFSIDAEQHIYDVSITGTRYYKWTSGYDSYNTVITAKRENFSLTSSLVSHGDADSGRRATYGFTNNGSQDITITCVLECKNTWRDAEHQMPDEDTVTDIQTIIVPAGQSKRQQLQAIPYDPGVTYSQSFTEYFTIEGVSTHYEPGDTITTSLPVNKDAFAVQLTPTTMGSYKDLQLTINKNTSTSDRSLVVKAMDTIYTSATKQLTITQSGATAAEVFTLDAFQTTWLEWVKIYTPNGDTIYGEGNTRITNIPLPETSGYFSFEFSNTSDSPKRYSLVKYDGTALTANDVVVQGHSIGRINSVSSSLIWNAPARIIFVAETD